jgi:hypothetical protein
LQLVVKNAFHIELNIGNPTESEMAETSKTRQDVFRLARNALLKTDGQSYSQQFQGLYALMRGLAGSFWMGSAYLLGWSLASIQNRWLDCVEHAGWIALVLALSVGFAMVFGNQKSKTRIILDRVTFASVLLTLFATGTRLGSYFNVTKPQLFTFILISVASIWCGARSFSSYKHYAEEFAKATWTDFLSHQSLSSATPKQ